MIRQRLFKPDKESIAYQLRKLIYRAAVEVVGKRKIKFSEIILEHPANPEHGDYATNIAMQIKHRGYLTSWDLANAIVNTLRSQGLPEFIAKIEVAKPGFINFWLHRDRLVSELERVLKEKKKYGFSNIGKGKTVIVDYSSPNIAKPFAIGHLRSTIIGQAIYNIYKFLGWKTIGDNHLGDWGTQFGKLIVAIGKWGRKKKFSIAELVKLYVKFHKEATKKPELDNEARVWFKKLEDGDREAKKIWRMCIEASTEEFQRIYDLLEVKIDYAYGESFYEDKMPAVIERAKRKKVAVKSEGAWVIKFPEFGIPPAMILKSDGATTYETRDLACIAYRKKRWRPDLYIYEVGVEQKLHFQQTFAAAVKLGYGRAGHFVHIAHGLIRLPSGKLSTRKGKVIYLEKVLEESTKRAKRIIEASETGRGLSKRKQEEVARAVGVGAVKYFDLMHHYSTGIVFDWEKMFVLEGNSGPYLQYTYARTRSVLRKAKQNGKLNSQFSTRFAGRQVFNSQFEPEELLILRIVYQFPEIVRESAEKFAPNLLCNFLYGLAQRYNLFYNRHSILQAGSPELVEGRLALTTATAQILENGLTLLGIPTPERM